MATAKTSLAWGDRDNRRAAHRFDDGMALVLALAFIVLITIIAVALSGMISIERPAASTHFEKMRASQLAQQAVDGLVATLDQQTANPNQTGQFWVSQPGQLVVSAPAATSAASPTPNPLATLVPLCTGTPDPAATPAAAYLQPVNLNLPTWQDPTSHLITEATTTNPDGSSATVPLAFNWVYVTRDGTPSVTLQPSPGSVPAAYNWTANNKYQPTSSNPIVGRYAYWADDESSKLNYNLAWGKTEVANPNPTSDPTNVSLTALQDATTPAANFTVALANALHGFITPNNYATVNRFFNTPLDARAVSPAVSTALQQYKFQVTHYNHDPGTTVFGEPRIVLTTRPDRAGWTYNAASGQWVGVNGLAGAAGRPRYLRLLLSEANAGLGPQSPAPLSGLNSNLDPGPLTNLDYPTAPDLGAAANDTLNFLVNELARQDWPLVGAANTASFKSKYYAAYGSPQDKERLAQLAIDIIDYVRAKESPDPLVAPLRAFLRESSAGVMTFSLGVPSTNSNSGWFMGLSRAPFITEIGCGSTGGKTLVVVEIYCPPNYGMSNPAAPIPMSALSLYLATTNGVFADFTGIGVPSTSWTDTLSSQNLVPGGYVVLSRVLELSTFPLPYQVSSLSWRVGLSLTAGNNPRLVLTPLCNDYDTGTPLANYYLTIPYNPAASSAATVASLECDDPRISDHAGAWHPPLGVINTFGAVNTRNTLGTAPTGTPQQDTDANGLLTDASFYMPAPAGTATNPFGAVTSVGELGYVPTGIEASTVSPKNLATKGSALVNLPVGTPWRTWRLQPNNSAGTTVLPDWALVDIFAAPNLQPNAAAVYTPHGSAVGGRVNLNAHPAPFEAASPSLARIYPLAAALSGCTYDSTLGASATLSFSTAYSLAGNIYNRTTSPLTNGSQGKLFGVPAGWSATIAPYVSAGEISEIRGIADRGERTEELVRSVENLLTVRGNVFTVYAVGQALKTTPTGALVVTGEQRMQTMIERNNADPTVAAVSFRPVYSRNLTP